MNSAIDEDMYIYVVRLESRCLANSFSIKIMRVGHDIIFDNYADAVVLSSCKYADNRSSDT